MARKIKGQEFLEGERVIIIATHYSDGSKLKLTDLEIPDVNNQSESEIDTGVGTIMRYRRVEDTNEYTIALEGRWKGEREYHTFGDGVFIGRGGTFFGVPTLRYAIRRENPQILANIEEIIGRESQTIASLAKNSGETQKATLVATLRNLKDYLQSK